MLANRLYNGGFENEFHQYQGRSALIVADGWTPWWAPQQRPPDPAWKNRRPEWKRATPTGNQMLGQWFAAVVRSGALEKFRWTVGTSADDAGIGDLNVRRVIAINPSTWGASLQAFYQQYYPGVEYRAIEANTPAELESVLVNWL